MGRSLRPLLLVAAIPLVALILAARHAGTGQDSPRANPGQDGAKTRAAALLDRLHGAAARADGKDYFACFADSAVFMGTAPGERWTLPEFRRWATPRFRQGRGWTFKVTARHLQGRGSFLWFDEVLENEHYGRCRGTGVLRAGPAGWLVEQYNLSIPVPDALAADLVRRIRHQPTMCTRVFVLRHAEKAGPPRDRDPDLSPAGTRRARWLAAMLRSQQLTAIYASQYKRTRQTVTPAATAAGLAVRVQPAGRERQLAATIAGEHRGGTILVAGHSNTVPALLQALGVKERQTIGEGDYHNLFMVTLRPGDEPELTRLHFPE